MIINSSFRVLLSLVIVLGLTAFDGPAVASAVFHEHYGHAGVLRTFKGQVRYSDDTPIPHATLSISTLGKDKEHLIETDEGGNFIKVDLTSGKYKIVVRSAGTNIGEFTLRISQGGPSTSSKYIIVKLSPGCASGDSGVELVSKIKKQKMMF
ncbi:MAG TPA: carboxypeptidase-like regulatory domain-containing protein [Pyrinomonadaceae bacterium]|nr:carboxypeptidase-like regulatory domain-containing protein [Pyrinomonadaceae bacterium]